MKATTTRRTYMDNAASTPLLPEVVEAMLPCLRDVYGNPSSLHRWGEEARDAVEAARGQVAALISGAPEEVILMASGSEANNMAVKGLARAREAKGRHIVVSAVEHFSVLHSARTMEKQGFEVTEVPVDANAVVDPDAVLAAVRPDTALVSVMLANGEVGTIEPVAEIGRALRERMVPFHTDAVAALGWIPVDVKALNVDALSLAANQFHGPAGAAALWIRRGVRVIPLIDGGMQEAGRRAGTENVAAIVGMGKAAEVALARLETRAETTRVVRDRLIAGVRERIPHAVLTGHAARRLPHHASFCIEFIEGESMLMLLSMQGVAVSSGSACTSRALKSSHVLKAMGIDAALAQGSIVFTLNESNTVEDADFVLDALPPVVDRLRQMSPLWDKFQKSGRKGA